jgi:dihydrofolate reductase
MLIYSMSVTADGYVTDRSGDFGWGEPSDDLLQHHLEEVDSLGAYLLGRRLYETMEVWETDPSMRGTPANRAFADVWAALPKVVFSRSLPPVRGAARLARASVADEIAAALASTDRPVSIGGAELASGAVELGLVDELRMIRYPVVVGGGTSYLPPVIRRIPLELVATRAFEAGAVLERYRVVR